MSKAGKLDLNLMQTAGSALAALSSAVVLSTLGATGTLVGAAVGSVVVTLGGTVYSHYLSVSRARVAAARNAALMRTSRAGQVRSKATTTDGNLEAVTRAVAEAPERFPLLAASARGAAPTAAMPATAGPGTASPDAPGPRLIDGYLPGTAPSFGQMLRGLRWRPALAASLGIFVLVMGSIVSMELATGRALSSYTGGSSAAGPRTSIALLSSTTDAGGNGSKTTDGTKDGGDRSPAGSGDTTGQDTGSKTAGDTGSSSTSGADSDSDAPQPDTSTPEPDAGTPSEPAPQPTPTEPAPEPTVPTPAPSTQPSVQAPAPATGAAVSGAAADSVS